MGLIILAISFAALILAVLLWYLFERAQIKLANIAGFEYDYEQNIFYSSKDAWQNEFGYSRLYDEAAPVSGMIIDCEPFYFDYDGKKWLIELWKGQYCMACGGEIGVYYRTNDGYSPDNTETSAALFKYVKAEDMLDMAFCVYKDRQPLFQRCEVTWWLTGFKLGEFANPNELIMTARIIMKDEAMLQAFADAVKSAGYSEHEFSFNGLEAIITFTAPRTPKPVSRALFNSAIIQKRNKRLCDMYNKITRDAESAPEKLALLRERNPFLCAKALKIGRMKGFYQKYGAKQKAGGLNG